MRTFATFRRIFFRHYLSATYETIHAFSLPLTY